MNDPFALHDVWLAAINALPDPRPIAALLRSDTPMPDGARHLLAELFHPGDPPISDFRLVPQRNPEFARAIRKFSATVAYRKALATAPQRARRLKRQPRNPLSKRDKSGDGFKKTSLSDCATDYTRAPSTFWTF
jgi:hypothetical protein